MKKLFLFTNSYPYGYGELWKTDELNVLVHFFETITVVPFSNVGKPGRVIPIKGIEYAEPLFDTPLVYKKWYVCIARIVFSKHIFLFLQEAFREKVFYSPARFKKWLSSSYKMLQIAKNKRFKNIASHIGNDSIVYFYWGREASEVLPVFKFNCFKIIARFHRYDLYKGVNDGYIPYQYFQIKKLSAACPCSDDGKKELASSYPGFVPKIITKRLGTISRGKASMSSDGVLRIVSCSLSEPVKRVDIILEALEQIDIATEWVHIGGGSMLEGLKGIAAKSTNPKVKFSFLGQLSSEEVINFYSTNTVDLFINTSASEGVPVSVMEALAAGIPVMATDVGGTAEIINSQVGFLLTKEITPIGLAGKINSFYSLSQEQKIELRNNAFLRYKDKCDAISLANEFAAFLNN